MDVYLMQHGEAMPAELDPSRSLSEVGQRSVEAVSRHAAACGVRVDRIVHSGKLRAVESALILGRALGCDDVRHVEGLSPGADVEAAAAALIDPSVPGSLAIVGHLPFLDRLASALVAGDSDAHVLAVRNGGLVKLVPAEPGWAVAWAITPEVARG
ncbi:MAG TPA: phosphohistidine phosphatase SixA [Motilibacterales bacterium]|nr:phosphohistidine phosphatase SixA [Motilibacterales bacterium]